MWGPLYYGQLVEKLLAVPVWELPLNRINLCTDIAIHLEINQAGHGAVVQCHL